MMDRIQIALLAGLLSLSFACGDDDENNGANNNGTTNNGTTNNGTTNNGTTNNGTTNNGTTNNSGGEASCATGGLDHSRIEALFNAGTNNEIADPQIAQPAEYAAPDLSPAAGSPAASGFVDPGDSFFETVSYRGAFSPTDNWADGWTEFSASGVGGSRPADAAATGTPGDHPAVTCDDANSLCTIEGTIESDLTLTANYRYVLTGGVFVGDDTTPTTLTVEPGVTVFGEERSFLAVTRSSKLMAVGTAAAPIIFTSARAVDDAAAQSDWGGIIINGRAPINSGAEAMGEGNTGSYGGTDPADDSGTLQYVVVAYAGFEITSDNELNAVAFQGVGSGTTVDYLHVHMGKDDGVEFFGGTVNVKHVLLTGIGDDNIDWTDGWTGKAQFVAAIQYDIDADNGIEADNSGDDNALTPISNPTLSNITLVGLPGSSKSDLGMLLREGTQASIYNSVVMGFDEACLALDQDATFANAAAGTLSLQGVLLHCPNSQPFCDLESVAAASGS